MKDIAIFGAGGFGRETALLIHQCNLVSPAWNVVGFYDDAKQKGDLIGHLKVLGGIAEVEAISRDITIVVAIADPLTRKTIVERLTKNSRVSFPTLAHPLAQMGDTNNSIGKGCVFGCGVVLTTNIRVDDFCIVNLATTIGHDVHLGSFSSVMPGCSISGNVMIGPGSFIGTGARVLPSVSIGANCVVGAGAVVTKSFMDNKTLVGIPAHD